MIIEITENEEMMYQQIIDWLSWKLNRIRTQIKQHKGNAIIIFYNCTFSDINGNKIYVTAKELDFLDIKNTSKVTGFIFNLSTLEASYHQLRVFFPFGVIATFYSS